MSKMPAKKKSCFQITSVTQAQVAAIGAADDTESLDDPDESRTEDVSSEIYDMSRAEYEPACDRSSSEEALNNVGEPEAPSHIPQAGHLPALSSNPMGEFRHVGVPGAQQQPGGGVTTGLNLLSQPGAMQQQQPPAAAAAAASSLVNTSQPATVVTSSSPAPAASSSSSSSSSVSCTSRFRVIKLDHGTGEPFRRGRWTCTEFYEKDSEGRTVDGIRHASATLDPAADRDSGLGQTGGSAVAPATHSGQGLGSTADASLPSSLRMHPVETLPQQQMHHQNYGARQQGGTGSTAAPQPVAGGLQPSALPVGQNGLPQSVLHMQKSPIMPPSAQTTAYPPQQQLPPLGHHLTGQSPGLIQNQTEYYQQQQQQPMLPTGQSLSASSASGSSSVLPPASGLSSGPSQVGDVVPGAGGGTVPQQQTGGMGGVLGSILVGGSSLQQQQQTAGQYVASGQLPSHGLHPASSGVQNVPAVVASSGIPAAVAAAPSASSSAAVPNASTSGFSAQMLHSGALGAQFLPATGFGLVEGGGGRKSEGLFNAHSPVVPGKEAMKPFMPEGLHLSTPAVNSLFGIHIPVDGDEDRNPSKAFYQAFQSGSRLRDSKAHSDSASGTNVVAIDNKIEQAMDLVKSHLMYAVREEVVVLKEQIKELFERNSVLERENAVLKSLANSEQLSQLPAQSAAGSVATPPLQGLSQPQALQQQQQAPPPLQPLQPLQHPQQQQQQQQLQTQLDPGQQLQQPNVTSA